LTGVAVAPALPAVLEALAIQERAAAVLAGSIDHPVHAYLFVGPPGTGRLDAARAFSAALVCPSGGCGRCGACHDVAAGRHPDVTVVERTGASISKDDARSVVTLAQRAPVVAARQVIIVTDVHLAVQVAPVLLKTLEEPPPSTVFILLAESVSIGLATIASRCVEVPFVALDATTLERLLLAEGVEHSIALAASSAAAGRLDRARLLARDPGFVERQQRWRELPASLDGTGATVFRLSREVLASADELVDVVRERQKEELEQASAQAAAAGEKRLPGRQAIEDRHKREQRRLRTDELRVGLASLASTYRSRLVAPGASARRLADAARALSAIDAAASALSRNANEALLLEALLLALDDST